MDVDLSGQVALVTGGSRGLGKEMVQAFAAAGADVVISSRKQDACDELAAAVRETTGRTALAVAAHAGRWDDIDRLVDVVYGELGRVDVLVNNAGMAPLYPRLSACTEELFDKTIGVNLKGPFRLGALIGERMVEGEGGSIINISSMASARPKPHTLPYAAAKSALNTMTIAMAHAYGPTVRVNAIMAGTFLTDVSKHWDAEAFARRAETFALQRGGQPEEITGAALYLASDLSSYTTGTILTVDGGQP